MKKRLSIALTLIIAVSIITCGIFSAIIFRQNYFKEAESNLTKNLKYASNYLLTELIETNETEDLNHFSKSTGLRITVINTQGNVIYESQQGLGELENHGTRPEIKAALKGNTATEVRFSETIRDQMIYVAAPFYQNNEVAGVIRVAMLANSLEDSIVQMINNLIFVLLITLLATVILVNYYINSEMKPLDEATTFARKIASGKYSQRLTMIRDDKIGEMVESLNQMASQLEASFENMNKRNSELTSILASMNLGVIAIDEDNKIIHMNDSAKKMIKISLDEKVIGKNLIEIYQSPFILDIMMKIKEDIPEKRNFESRIDSNHFFKIYINDINDNKKKRNGFIVILEDITILKNLEKIRRDFVANVSHELKTPITSIKGFVETIQENNIKDEATLNRFYCIIADESDRLSRLTEDILVLSQLENKSGLEPNIEKLEIRKEIFQIFDILKLHSEEKGINLVLTNKKEIYIQFNRDEFRQMILNLIDNAIKYSETNKIVTVSIEEEDQNMVIYVKDEGYGIPEKDVSRIFERFYRVEKSRSKENGGTGLGLAIVKHIVQNFNGSIEVNSKIGEGTTFKIVLPQK
ncbi:MAG: ATP-binding protein [Eubacteriaceae bacterium]